MTPKFEARLTDRYSDLSGALRAAADHLARNPVELATRTLRSIARESGISPAAFSRLARALGYDDIEALREEMRGRIEQRANGFAGRAERLHNDPKNREAGGFLEAHFAACQGNLRSFIDTVDRTELERAVERLGAARKVLLLGSLGSTGVVEYLSYMANFCADNWALASRSGASLGSGLVGLGPEDALIIVTKPPFSDRAIRATRLARDQGVYVVLITDTLECPALKYASARFIVPTGSQHFYSSYVTTVFLVECLIGMLVSRSGPAARGRIAEVEAANRVLAEVWDL
ncbi:MurR/RpiR family transcriptional regulator [Vannielia litorea]|uniref:MurR/RpiR family transcriptional regulator n=1 Tax=Vannielia litorea TaxID=1217970 RepID=UPI001C939146|nr:MurR/RpiR family transcriptional regulator [Vannielia litorea]MBY6153355.1 MurR/RpiR family transcriptional regulator [Vannielia litorea]